MSTLYCTHVQELTDKHGHMGHVCDSGATLHKIWATFKCAAATLKATSSSLQKALAHTSPEVSKQHSYWTKKSYELSQKAIKQHNIQKANNRQDNI